MKNIKIVNNFTVKKSESRFGIVRTISRACHLVIGEEQWNEIKKLEPEQNLYFQDEQEEAWEAWLDEDGNFTFFHPKCRELITVKPMDLI